MHVRQKLGEEFEIDLTAVLSPEEMRYFEGASATNIHRLAVQAAQSLIHEFEVRFLTIQDFAQDNIEEPEDHSNDIDITDLEND